MLSPGKVVKYLINWKLQFLSAIFSSSCVHAANRALKYELESLPLPQEARVSVMGDEYDWNSGDSPGILCTFVFTDNCMVNVHLQ